MSLHHVNSDDDSDVNNTSTKFSYEHVAQLVGPYRPVQVIDTSTQLTTVYTLQEWVEYLYTKKEERTRILNVITLDNDYNPLQIKVYIIYIYDFLCKLITMYIKF